MNIKSIVSGAVPIEPKTKSEASANVKAKESSADRDADGRSDTHEDSPKRELSDEELEEAVEHLKSLPGVKEHSLKIRVKEVDGLKIIYIEDLAGNLIRRVPAPQVWLMIQDKDKPKGQILDKAM